MRFAYLIALAAVASAYPLNSDSASAVVAVVKRQPTPTPPKDSGKDTPTSPSWRVKV
ncbi:hypothetical protein AG1IA_01605 [Rhizoctonia solani AG-1 IA]|uniref:Uncharacterized protein n=1 Tax=Thanatephorus cucumeris (strain AG1-IA) TaxID=983506 RepID=L8X5J7_THACA|nr:hypothetical protein AG1IA_01605 [Rhizoctonia solani AG-1 IA]